MMSKKKQARNENALSMGEANRNALYMGEPETPFLWVTPIELELYRKGESPVCEEWNQEFEFKTRKGDRASRKTKTKVKTLTTAEGFKQQGEAMTQENTPMPEVKKHLTARQALRLKRKKLRARVNAARSELAQVEPLLAKVEAQLAQSNPAHEST
jgi:hypothetical protein